jgi:hypothetical protein
MAAKKYRRLPSSRERIRGALSLRGQQYPFEIRKQIVNLGSAGPLQYCYMLLSDLRGRDPTQDESNFRSCVGFWWAAMHELGLENDWCQQRHFVMATCYALVNRNKSLQDVYLDALPRPDSIDSEKLWVPDEIRERIRELINRRDRPAVKEELDRALGIYQLTREDSVGFAKAFQTWADKGVNSFRELGEEGVIAWLGEVDYWMGKYRKRCPPRVRSFVNFFSYQAKVSFYTCYANFWARLIPWLEENHKLDELTVRFLKLWHNQNKPIEVPLGKTTGGIWYPTRRGARLLYPREDGKVKVNGVWVDNRFAGLDDRWFWENVFQIPNKVWPFHDRQGLGPRGSDRRAFAGAASPIMSLPTIAAGGAPCARCCKAGMVPFAVCPWRRNSLHAARKSSFHGLPGRPAVGPTTRACQADLRFPLTLMRRTRDKYSHRYRQNLDFSASLPL